MADHGKHPYPPCFAGDCTYQACCAEGAYRWSWPETVGKDTASAMKLIEETNRLVRVVKILKGSYKMTDFCCNRVYLVFDANDNVAEVPIVG